MCGFAGAFSFDDPGKKFHARTPGATRTLRHRGPDDEGLFDSELYSVGHRRLKIIDLSELARQPMQDEKSKAVLAFNGEIYNYRSLRQNLIRAGVNFISSSDTEVLMRGLLLEGTSFIEKLDGEFAFSFYTPGKNEMILARDRYGIKPLYFYRDDHVLLFASELRGIMQYGIPKEIDPAALQLYFHLNYIPAPYTILKNVHKAEKGSFTVINLKGEQRSFPIGNADTQRNDTPLCDLLQDSVEKRLNADVPVGCFLSGGIDSTIITGMAARIKKDIHSFSIGFPDSPYFDETSFALKAAAAFCTEHHVFEVRNKDLMTAMEFLFSHLDEPFADSSALPMHLLCHRTSGHLKVVLSGDGADELFGGYNKHEAECRITHSRIPKTLSQAAARMLSNLPSSRNSGTGNRIRQAKKYFSASLLPRPERYWMMAGFTEGRKVLRDEFEDIMAKYTCKEGSNMNDVLEADINLVLENDMLVKVDRMSMASSLEVRVPYLSNEFSAHARSVPPDKKISSRGRKLILKESFRELLPAGLDQRAKQGFEVPLLEWFRGPLQPLIKKEISNKGFLDAQGIFRSDQLARLNAQLLSHSPDDSPATLYAFLIFQHWYRNYFLS